MATEQTTNVEWDENLARPTNHIAALNRRIKVLEADLTAAEDSRNKALDSSRALSLALAGEGLETMRATKKVETLRLANGILRTARADAEHASDEIQRRLDVMDAAYTAAQRQVAARYDDQGEANRLLNLALHLCQHGENAPGGTETWAQFAREAETYLRRGMPDSSPKPL